MSFIVKGFDIPKDAIYFKLSFYDGNRENEYGVSGSLKPYIIQIPKGHGRLIDVSDLYICGSDSYEQRMIDEGIADAPTILEAEGEDVHKSNV